MYIESLNIKKFRNYENAKVEFSKRLNIIYGENAQGKTNIIEAIFLCASGRSHRTSKDSDLVKINSSGYYVNVNIDKQYTKDAIEINYETGKKKIIRINEITVKKLGNLMGNLTAVIFSPEDLLIIKEGPSQRRRFIDITICQIKPSYFYDLQQYNKILLQRNALLREIQKNRSLIDTLEVWDKNIASVASKIMKVRFEFIKRLGEITKNKHYKLTDGKEELKIDYFPSVKTDAQSINEIEKEIIKNFINSRNAEIKRGLTLIGPHRDDYEMILDGMNLKLYGSQGQQRTSILSIKLSEIELIKSETGEYPVLLLDDVMSELDKNRRKHLLENLGELQTFITCTEKESFEINNFGETMFIRVENGVVETK